MTRVHGSQRITADGVVGVSGKPVMLYGVHVKSEAGGGGVVILYNGTSASGTELARYAGSASEGVELDLGEGRFFPSGLYADVDSNTTYATFDYEMMAG